MDQWWTGVVLTVLPASPASCTDVLPLCACYWRSETFLGGVLWGKASLAGWGPCTSDQTQRRERINMPHSKEGVVWQGAKPADHFLSFLSIQATHGEILHIPTGSSPGLRIRLSRGEKKRINVVCRSSYTEMSDKVWLTGKVTVRETSGSDTSCWALDDSEVLSVVLKCWHKCCLFAGGLLHPCLNLNISFKSSLQKIQRNVCIFTFWCPSWGLPSQKSFTKHLPLKLCKSFKLP